MNNSTDSASFYLRDLGELLKQAALEAKAQRDLAGQSASAAFENGRLMAYFEIVSLMRQQAVAFDIPLNELSLDDIDPDRDLL